MSDSIEDDGEELMERLGELLASDAPMDMADATKRVARFLLHEFRQWSSTFSMANDKCLANTGQSITPGDPIFAGIVLTLIHLCMAPENEPAIDQCGSSMRVLIPHDAKHGVRRTLNKLFNGMGLSDDSHLLN